MLSNLLGWLPHVGMHSDITEPWCKRVGNNGVTESQGDADFFFNSLTLHGVNKIEFPNKKSSTQELNDLALKPKKIRS